MASSPVTSIVLRRSTSAYRTISLYLILLYVVVIAGWWSIRYVWAKGARHRGRFLLSGCCCRPISRPGHRRRSFSEHLGVEMDRGTHVAIFFNSCLIKFAQYLSVILTSAIVRNASQLYFRHILTFLIVQGRPRLNFFTWNIWTCYPHPQSPKATS